MCVCVVGFTLKAGVCKPISVLSVAVKLTRKYEPALADPTSKAFVELASTVESTMDNALSSQNIPGYDGVQVARFSKGSTVAETVIKFQQGATVSLNVAASVGGKLKAAAESGQLNALGLTTTTFEVKG